MAYSHLRPTLKQANVTVQDALAALNPTDSLLKDYAIYAGGGGLAGAGIGALVNALRGQSKLKGALVGGGIGAGAGAGVKALGDYLLSDQVANIAQTERELAALRKNYPMRMGGGTGAKFLEGMDALLALDRSRTAGDFERRYMSQLQAQKNENLLDALSDSIAHKYKGGSIPWKGKSFDPRYTIEYSGYDYNQPFDTPRIPLLGFGEDY